MLLHIRPGVRGSARSAVADPKIQLHCTVADQKFGVGQCWPTLNFWQDAPTLNSYRRAWVGLSDSDPPLYDHGYERALRSKIYFNAT